MGTQNKDWWPSAVDISILHTHSQESSPERSGFNYAEAFESLDLSEVRTDIFKLMQDSQDWWPADYGHYGPFFIRMAWHSAGTYRTGDGRGGAAGGTQRFAPLNSWPDNGNLDKARRLLWPVKQKYGANLSWADLMIFAGNCALESMGFKTLGFAGGRADYWAPEADIYWGREAIWLTENRYAPDRDLEHPLAAVQMGLIYVNPEGPDGNPDPLASAKDIRETFGRMAMNDEETVALVAGGHTFGKAHGAGSASLVGPEPEAAPIEMQGLGWANQHGDGLGADTITSGIEGAWTATPTQWDNSYLDTLFGHDWELTKSPAGAHQWRPVEGGGAGTVPDAHLTHVSHAPMMTTADIALKADPTYEAIARRFQQNPDEFADAFAKAWFKLTHRDMGPRSRYKGREVPGEIFLWQDPVPTADYPAIDESDITTLKGAILDTGLGISDLVAAAWASASTYRGSDGRGGSNGGRVRLPAIRDWPVNNPPRLTNTLAHLSAVQKQFNETTDSGAKVSMADLIVIGGAAAIEKAAARGGHPIEVPVMIGRTDASADSTDFEAYKVLEPEVDGFRNFAKDTTAVPSEELLIDKAQLLGLSAPEMTALMGGLRALNVNTNSTHGVFTERPGVFSNDFFTNLLDMEIKWSKRHDEPGVYTGICCKTLEQKFTATAVDLVCGSNAQLRAIAEHYAQAGGEQALLGDFVDAWVKVMNNGFEPAI